VPSTWTEGLSGEPAAGRRTCAQLFRVLAADRPLGPSARYLLADCDTVTLGRGEDRAAEVAKREGVCTMTVRIADNWMSSSHARLTRVMGKWVLEDAGSKNGVRLNGNPVQREELEDGDVFELGRTFFLFRRAAVAPADEAPCVESDALPKLAPGLETLQVALSERFAQLATVAPSTVTVAVRGPTGSGKEVVARAVHALSGRPGAFVPVNCGALPDELVESELYGHKKGAFSGAVDDRQGLVRAAHGGTLFLDEVGDLPGEAQPALLRVLQERLVTPVGATAPVPADVRVVSATHRDLEALAKEDAFRDDLRARLMGFELTLPALIDRREDLGQLLAGILPRVAGVRAASVQFSLEAARALMLYGGPANVRELEKVVEAAVVLAGDQTVALAHLPEAVRASRGRPRPAPDAEKEKSDAERKAQLEALLAETDGNVSAVARAMGKARMQVHRWMQRYGLDPRSYRR